jgi:hypothetical protein
MASQPDQHLHLIQAAKAAWIWSDRCASRKNTPHWSELAGADAAIRTSVTARCGDETLVLPKFRKFRSIRKPNA